MCRRFVLSLLFFLTVFMTGCSDLLCKTDSSIANLSSDPNFLKTINELDSIVSQINEKHSVRVYYKKRPVLTWGRCKYTLASKSEYGKVLKYLKMLQDELNKYPEGFLRKAEVERIVVCKELSSRGHSIAGHADPWSKTVYTCPGFNNTSANNPFVKSTIHHELYHRIEATFNGSPRYKDPVWAKLNSTDFKYGKGGMYFKRNKSNPKSPFHPNAGFVRDYSKSALEEDKATVYTALFVEEISACLADWIEEDEILRNKVNYMKDFLLKHCDEMTSDFWANLRTDQCSPLWPPALGSAIKQYEIQDSRFSVELSDNAVVELIAIGEGSGNSEKWWKPNGEILGEAPFTIHGNSKRKIPIDDGLKRYRFFFYVGHRNSQSYGFSCKWDSPDGRIYQYQCPCHNKDSQLYLGVCGATGGLDKDKEVSQIMIGILLDEWIVEATYNPKTKVTGGTNHSVKFARPHKKNGDFDIEVSHSITDFRDMSQQIVAVDRAGEIHHPARIQGSVIRSEVKRSFHFSDLRLAQVKEFQFKTCPYTWITFENISLRPGQITDVLIKVENN